MLEPARIQAGAALATLVDETEAAVVSMAANQVAAVRAAGWATEWEGI